MVRTKTLCPPLASSAHAASSSSRPLRRGAVPAHLVNPRPSDQILREVVFQLRQAVDDDLPHAEFLLRLPTNEVERRDANRSTPDRARRASSTVRRSRQVLDFPLNSELPKTKTIDPSTLWLHRQAREPLPRRPPPDRRSKPFSASAPVPPLGLLVGKPATVALERKKGPRPQGDHISAACGQCPSARHAPTRDEFLESPST